jgi:hypothetical protein
MRRRTQLTETFESSVHEDNKNKFYMDATLYKGIKYHLPYLGTMMSAKSSTYPRRAEPSRIRTCPTR